MIFNNKIELILGLRCYGGGGNFGTSSSSNKNKPQLTPQQLLDTYNANLPATLATTAGLSGPVGNTLSGASLNQLNNLGGAFQEAGGELAQRQGLSTAELIAGTGGLSASLGNQLNTMLNPVQAASNPQAANLVNSINLNGLSGGEQAAVERSLNQSNEATGNLGLDNATNAVKNAMNFGGALASKRAQLGAALGAAGGVSANQQAQVNPLGTALSAGNTSNNFALGQFNPAANASAPLTFGASIFNPLAANASASVGKGGSSSVNFGGQGGTCCFIFLESYHGVLPYSVRRCRDHYYRHDYAIAKGYIKMASWLVPAMKRSSLVAQLVWKFMVNPLTQYGEFVVRHNKTGKQFKNYRKFWFTIWKLIGKTF